MTPRAAVAASFALNGLLFATLAARLPTVRDSLELSNGALGLLLLVGSAASVAALVASGRVISRLGVRATVVGGSVLCAVGLLLVAAASAGGLLLPAGAGMLLYGAGVSLWDVAMNVEGAEVERRLGRTIMPRFHAGWSLGSISGAGLGIPLLAWGVPILAHVGVTAVLGAVAACWSAGRFVPAADEPGPPARSRSAWREPRTLAIGVMVLAFAMVEGTAYDWLAIALIDGYDVAHWVGTAGFATFVTAMLLGRMVGPAALDRFGRRPVLWACVAAATVGSLLTVLGGHPAVAAAGVVCWGLGASLGFPVGMSAAADEPARAAARLGVVSTIGYGAFLAGPPLLGQLAELVGALDALLVVTALMLPAAVSVLAARPSRSATLPPQRLEL